MTFGVILSTGLCVYLQSAGIKTLKASFEYETQKNGTVESVKGILYYKAPDVSVAEVSKPVKQIMSIRGGEMTIYYPDTEQAFVITSKAPFPQPIIETILSMTKDEHGLPEKGFKLERHEKKDGLLFKYWRHSKKENELGTVMTQEDEEGLKYAEIQIPSRKLVVKSFYRNARNVEGWQMAQDIESQYYLENKLEKTEKLSYSEIVFNGPLPDHILNFKIPEAVTPKRVEW